MLLTAILLATAAAAAAPGAPAAPAPASAPAPSTQELPLTDEPQVAELCTSLRDGTPADADPAEEARARRDAEAHFAEALSKTYRVEIPSKGFAFGRYLASESRLELDGDRPLKALDGALTLDLEGIDDVGFSAKPDQVSAWAKEKKAGTLRLAVVFRPVDRCAGNPRAQAHRVSGRATSWQLVGAQGVLASADSEGEPAGVAPPKAAHIEKISLETEATSAEEGRERIAGVQGALDRCASHAQRPGNVVVQFAISGGHIREPVVILDSVRDEAVARCVAQALSGAAVNGAASGRGTAAITLQ